MNISSCASRLMCCLCFKAVILKIIIQWHMSKTKQNALLQNKNCGIVRVDAQYYHLPKMNMDRQISVR